MKKLFIKESENKPFASFDGQNGKLQLGGISLPENVLEEYKPILTWLEEYTVTPKESTFFEFFFDYLNTASTYMVLRIVRMLATINTIKEVKVNWYYSSGDLEMKELGEELFIDSTLPYELVARDVA